MATSINSDGKDFWERLYKRARSKCNFVKGMATQNLTLNNMAVALAAAAAAAAIAVAVFFLCARFFYEQ